MNVFIAGPRKVSNLNNHVKERLHNIINNNFNFKYFLRTFRL